MNIERHSSRSAAAHSGHDGLRTQSAALSELPYPPPAHARLALCVVTLAYVLSFIDRQVLSLLVEPMKRDLGISDVQVSLLQGLAFASIYCLSGLPLGRAADQFSRRNIIAWGVSFWSVMTCLCGVARNYSLLMVCRAGVGRSPTRRALLARPKHCASSAITGLASACCSSVYLCWGW